MAQKMLMLSRNYHRVLQMFGVPPNTLPFGNSRNMFGERDFHLQLCHSLTNAGWVLSAF